MALRITTKGRYGIRAMCMLAKSDRNTPLTIQCIADQENIPIRYLEQIMVRLRRAGILMSIRGPGGGYSLNASPDRLSIGCLLRALEGEFSVVWCANEKERVTCRFTDECLTQPLWAAVTDTIKEILDCITLQDLIDNRIRDMNMKELINRGIG